MSAFFTINHCGRPIDVSIVKTSYLHGGLAVHLMDPVSDDIPYATLSVNVADIDLADDEFVFKTYSENEGLLEALIDVGMIERTGRFADVGLAGRQPICRVRKSDIQSVAQECSPGKEMPA